MATEDEHQPTPATPPRDGSPPLKPRLLRCRDCKAYTLYGPEVCSYCLSEHLEWLSPGHKEREQLRGPR